MINPRIICTFLMTDGTQHPEGKLSLSQKCTIKLSSDMSRHI